MKALDIALFLMDAKLSWQNAGKHLKHAKQLGMSNKEYKNEAQKLSEKPAGGNIIYYKRKDGREVKLNTSTKEYVVYKGDSIITYYKLNESQYKRATKGEY